MEKHISKTGFVIPSSLLMKIGDLEQIAAVSDCNRLDRELDHLRYLGIMRGGIYTDSDNVDLTPSDLGLQMYVRCQGSKDSPSKYFGLEPSIEDKS